MQVGESSGPIIGIDTVAVSGTATALPIDFRKMRRTINGQYHQRLVKGLLALHITFTGVRWEIRLQVSLPKVISLHRTGWANNFTPVPLVALEEAIKLFTADIHAQFPELKSLSADDLKLSRIDFAFDLPVPYSPELVHAMRDCYIGGRNAPGFVWRGKETSTFYGKDYRGQRGKVLYRTLIAYGKRCMGNGVKGIRLESRLHRSALIAHCGRPRIKDLTRVAPVLLRDAWRQIDRRFEFLSPTAEYEWERRVRTIRHRDSREMMKDVGFFVQELPLFEIAREPIADRIAVVKYMRQLALGYGDPDRPEIVAFANVRRELSEMISTPY